jgi:hypothetical protein
MHGAYNVKFLIQFVLKIFWEILIFIHLF